MERIPKIFGFKNRYWHDQKVFEGLAISEDGWLIAAHMSATIEQLIADLGMDGISKSYHSRYAEFSPQGFVLEFIEDHRINSEGRLLNAIKIAESRKRQGKPFRFVSGSAIVV